MARNLASGLVALASVGAWACTFSPDDFQVIRTDQVGTGGTASGGTASGTGGGSNATGGANNTGGAVGTGGATGTGGASSTGGAVGTGGTGTGGTSGCDPGVDCPGYIVSGAWKGEASTAVWGGSGTAQPTIMPANFDASYDFPLCASGQLPASMPGSAYYGAQVLWNVNQAVDSTANTATPTKQGILVSVTQTGMAELTLQIQGPNGETDANERWCASIGTGGQNIFVPYSSLNTECWEGGNGTAYNMKPFELVMVQVSSGDAALNYDFCINSLEESDDPN